MFDTTAHDFSSGNEFSDGSFSVRDVSLRQVCFVIFFAGVPEPIICLAATYLLVIRADESSALR